jgi:hypothetical protein
VLLKARQDFGYFPAPNEVHAGIVAHVAMRLGLAAPHLPTVEVRWSSKLYRYHAAVRAYLGVRPYGETAERLLSCTVLDAAETMSDPADLINRAIEALHAAAIDLPGFSTLDRLVSRLRAELHGRIFNRVAESIAHDDAAMLDAMLIRPPNSLTTAFNGSVAISRSAWTKPCGRPRSKGQGVERLRCGRDFPFGAAQLPFSDHVHRLDACQ